jgi:Tfp pilus assembly protein PilV
MQRQSVCPEAGFSLVEVLVAAGILATALVSIAALFPRAVEVNLAARTRVHATILAVQKIEELRASVSSSDAVAGSGEDRVAWSGETAEGSGPGVSAFVRRWQLASATSGFVLLRVQVTGPPTGILSQERAEVTTFVRVGP